MIHSRHRGLRTMAFCAYASVGLLGMAAVAFVPPHHKKPHQEPDWDVMFDDGLNFFKRGNPMVKEVALSIDDGPHILYAPKILDVLRQNHTHATFFVVGKKVLEHPELVREMVADGNEVGNHSMTHPRFNTIPVAEVQREISECDAVVEKVIGKKMTLLRPPGERYTDEDLRAAKGMNYITVAANIGASDYILPGDRSWYRGNPGYNAHVKDVLHSVLKQLKNGAIIDVHDMPTTADALDDMIKGIRRRGYKIVTVSELMAHLPHHPS